MAFGDFVKSTYLDNGTSPWTSAYSGGVTKGDLLIAAFGRAAQNVATVTDTQSNPWRVARVHFDAGQGYQMDVYYTIAGSTGANSVTVTAAGGSAESIIAEYAGPYRTFPLDSARNSAIGTSTTPSSGLANPSVTGALAIGYMGCVAGTTIAPSGAWTEDVDGTPDTTVNTSLNHQVRATTDPVAATGTLGGSVNWISLLVFFLPVEPVIITGVSAVRPSIYRTRHRTW